MSGVVVDFGAVICGDLVELYIGAVLDYLEIVGWGLTEEGFVEGGVSGCWPGFCLCGEVVCEEGAVCLVG